MPEKDGIFTLDTAGLMPKQLWIWLVLKSSRLSAIAESTSPLSIISEISS